MRLFKFIFAFLVIASASVTVNHAQTLVRGPGSAALDPMFREVLAVPNDIELNLAFARKAIELEDFEAAVATLERLLIGRADLPLIRLELGMLYLRLEAPELAEAYFLQVLETPGLAAEPRNRAEILLAETRKANAKGSFGASVSLGLKHSSNAVTKPHREDLVAENDLREQYSADWALRNLVLEGLVQDYYDNNLPNSDAAATSSLAFSYSRELDGLTERRFNASISHYTSHQGGEDLENLDIGVTSMRLGLVLPIQRRAKQPLSIDPYFSASVLDTADEDGFSTSAAFGLVLNGYLSPRRPVALSFEVGAKEHKLARDELKNGGRYNIGLTLGHIHSGGGYSSLGLRFDQTDSDDDFENLVGGNFSLSHSRPLGAYSLGANLGWRESRRDGFQTPPPGFPIIELRRHDKDLNLGLSLSRVFFNVAVNLGISYIERDSNMPGSNYDDITGTLTFSRSFQ